MNWSHKCYVLQTKLIILIIIIIIIIKIIIIIIMIIIITIIAIIIIIIITVVLFAHQRSGNTKQAPKINIGKNIIYIDPSHSLLYGFIPVLARGVFIHFELVSYLNE